MWAYNLETNLSSRNQLFGTAPSLTKPKPPEKKLAQREQHQAGELKYTERRSDVVAKLPAEFCVQLWYAAWFESLKARHMSAIDEIYYHQFQLGSTTGSVQ